MSSVGLAGNRVQRTHGAIEIEHDHFVGNLALDGFARSFERFERFFHQTLVADVGEKSCFLLSAGLTRDLTEDFLTQRLNAFSSQGRSAKDLEAIELRRMSACQV